MNVGMISNDFFPNVGGIAVHVWELSRALGQRGHHVVIVTQENGLADTDYGADNVEVHRVPGERHSRHGRVQYPFKLWAALRRLIRERSLDVLHCHVLEPDTFITKFVGPIPVVVMNCTSRFMRQSRHPEFRPWFRFLFQHAAQIIAPSQEIVQLTRTVGISPTKIQYVPNGVNTEIFHPQVDGTSLRKRWGWSEEHAVFFCPRRLIEKDGVIYLVRALPGVLEAFPHTRVVITGTGPSRPQVERELQQLGASSAALLVGDVPHQEMPAYYAASDAIVLPSLFDATSMSGLEALAMGKPLVGTAVGGIPQVITEGVTGLLVPPADSPALEKALRELLSQRERWPAMARTARRQAEREFSWPRIAARVEAVYQKAVHR